MRIGFNTNYCNTFTKNVLHHNGLKIKSQSKEDEIEDKVEFTTGDKKPEEIYGSPITKNTVNKFVQFYYVLPEESRESVHFCLMDDEGRYGAILDRIDKIEGKDRHIKPKKSFTEKFLDLMMLPDVISDNARYDVEELAQLPAFDNGKNENVHKILIELSGPSVAEEENNDSSKDIETLEAEEFDDDDDLFLDTNEERRHKLNFFKKAAAFFVAAK